MSLKDYNIPMYLKPLLWVASNAKKYQFSLRLSIEIQFVRLILHSGTIYLGPTLTNHVIFQLHPYVLDHTLDVGMFYGWECSKISQKVPDPRKM